MMMRVTTAAAILAAAVSTMAAAQEPRPVTLDEALRLAAQAQPAMVQARQDVRRASASSREAIGAWLPNLTFNGSASQSPVGLRFNSATQTFAPAGFPQSESYTVSSSLDLFTGLRRGAARHSAMATVDQREATLLRQEYTVALQTKQTFFDALRAAALVNVQQTRLRAADEQLRLTAERLRLGATTRSDSLRARVEYGNAQLALIQAQNDFRTAQANLGRAIQVTGLATPVYDSTIETRVANLDTASLRREAQASAPTVQEAEAGLASASASVTVARSYYMPTLSASGRYNWSSTGDSWIGNDPLRPTWSIGLSLSFPIFDRFARETRSVNASADVQSAEARLRDARLAIDASLSQWFSTLEAAAARIDIGRVSVQAAEEDLRLQRERYRLGAVTIIEVLASQGNLDQAQVDLVQARYDYLVARAQIEALVGHGL
jgi:outer membrane protein